MSFDDTETKDCAACPSFLSAGEASSFFGITVTAPMCARFGYLMADPSPTGAVEANGEVTEHWAAKCDQYGKVRPAAPTGAFQPVLFMPDTDALDKVANDTTVTSCAGCVNLFHSGAHAQYGCKPRGIVVFKEKMVDSASGCAWRSAKGSTPVPAVKNAKLVPPFDKPVVVRRKVTPRKTALFATIDPVDSASDAPVDDSMKDTIQAWRKVTINSGRGTEVFIPIFRTDFFPEEDQEFIPKRGAGNGDPSLYVDHSGLLEKFAVVSYKRDMMLTLVGEPGSGKTEGVRWLAWQMNMPFLRLNYNEYSEPEQFLGLMGAKGGDTGFEPGLLPRGWVKPGFILSDEWNLPQEGIQQVYRSMNDASRELVIYDQRFQRHDYCFHLTAINPAYDFRNIGAKEIASADVRRLSYHFMPMPDKATARAIIMEAVKRLDDEALPPAVADAILKVADDLRESSKQGKLPHHWTLSQDVKVARLALDFDLETAYRVAYFDYIDPQTAETHMQMVKSIIPAGL